MNFRTTYILFGLLIGVLGIFLVTQLFGTRTKDKEKWVLPSLHDEVTPVKLADIDRVEIDRVRPKAEKLLFYRDERGDWRLKEPQARVDKYLVERVISQVIGASKEKDVDLTPDLAKFGLDSPAEVVTLYQKGTDREWKLNLGESSAGGEKAVVYVTSSDQPKEPMAVRRGDLDPLFKNLNDFRSKSLLADSAFDIVGVRLEAAKRDPVELQKSADNKWHFEKPAFGEADYEGEAISPPSPNAPPRMTGVKDLLDAVAGIRVESEADFGDTGVSDTELTEKGVETGKAERLTIQVKRQSTSIGEDKKEPVSDTLLIGKKADDKGEKLFARLESERNLVKVDAKKVDQVVRALENPSLLRNRDLVQLDSTRVDAIDIRLNERDLVKLRKSGEPATWKIFDAGKAQAADGTAVMALLTALGTKRQVRDFPEFSKTDADLGLDKPVTVLSVWVDGVKKEEKKPEPKDERKDAAKDEKAKDEKKAEPKDEKANDEKKDAKAADQKKEEKKDTIAEPALKDEKPTVKLAFGRKDKDVVYVKREVGSDVTRLALPAGLLDRVSEGKLAYLDRKLPSFSSLGDIDKVVLTRGTETLELERIKNEKSPDVWKLKQPKDLAGRSADATKINFILSELQGLQAEKLIAEKATDNELERFGLKSPAVKATLTAVKADKKTEDHSYLLGKETDDKSGIYAKQGENDLVYVVRKNVLDSLQGDLLDPTIFSFDLSKVKGVKIVGWQDVVGSAFTLDLERKSAQNWVVKSPPEFKLDLAQIENFISGLTNLRAEKFVMPKTAAKPEHKLDLKDGALEITITLEGEKDPFTLTVGGLSGDSYYVKCNKVADEIFMMPKDRFEKVKSKPAYFKKD